jgi:anti-sigma factor RsiW
MSDILPVGEADLHAWLDGQLAGERSREVEAYLAARPEEAARVAAWRAQKESLRALFDPVQDEPVPTRLTRAASRPRRWWMERFAAGVAVALIGGAAGWGLRGAAIGIDAQDGPEASATSARSVAADRSAAGLSGAPAAASGPQVLVAAGEAAAAEAGFARRAAIAHAVFAPDQRRPVEIDAAHEEQLVAWLSKRLGAPMRAPRLADVGYALEGGRVLPGGRGPVAQLMYRDAAGARLTLYVSDEVGAASVPRPAETAFRFAREGAVNVFYWVDGPFGYALSAEADRAELARVSAEVYRQLGAR